MNVLQSARPTAVPAVAFLVWWPLFALLPGRYGRTFFILASVATLAVIEGPWIAAGLGGAILLAYVLVEGVLRLQTGRAAAFAALLVLIHAAYWACFYLPLPDVFASMHLRPVDKNPTFVLFSGIGVTFFRLVSYAWDRWRNAPLPPGEGSGGGAHHPPTSGPSFRDYLAYMLFFPQLRHGPVERAAPFSAQLTTARQTWTPRDLGIGLLRVGVALASLGLLRSLAKWAATKTGTPLSNEGLEILSHPEQLSAIQVLLLVHAPLLILYVLESSYARLQLGVGRIFGVRGTENFNSPLLATNPGEVWHRWNITVSKWLRDYAYIPLGGNRRHKYLNITLVFVYCGLLHALQLRCAMWGLWTGGTLAAFLWIADRVKGRPAPAAWTHPVFGPALRCLARIATYVWLCIGVTIILDPEYCGLKVLWRYLQIISGGLIG
jgi:D-alanyl-lipoteichoic acid acyltransferase DltB (MBOAT superfamily)